MNLFNKPAAVICLAFAATAAHAEEAAFDFNIPAQPVRQVLDALGKQAGLAFVYADQSVQGVNSTGVAGHLTLREAVARALAGTGLAFQFTAEKTVAIRPAAAGGRAASEPAELDAVTVTATRTERRVDEVPASVTVLTAKKLATKNRQNVYDALRNEVGLDFVSSTGVAHQVEPTIRGVGGSFSGSTTLTLVDGLPSDTASSSVIGHGGLNFASLQDVERVEVLRGPASALYGYGAIGGVLNVISKRWKGEAGAAVDASYGSHNTQKLGAAVGTTSDNFDVRLSAYGAKSDGFVATPAPDRFGGLDAGPRDWREDRFVLLSGFRPADNHEVTLDLRQYGTRSAGTYGGRPNDRLNLDGNSATVGYRFDLSDVTNIQAKFRATHLRQAYSFDNGDWNGQAVPSQVTAPDLPLAHYGGRTTNATKLLVQVDTRPFAGNQLIVGYGHDSGDYQTDDTDVGGATGLKGSKDKADALFVQDEHEFGPFRLTAGVRYDRLHFAPDTVNGVPLNGNASTDNVVTPRLGGRYHLNASTSFYASAGTAYLPALNKFKFVQPSTTRVDNPNLKPERSTSYEIGMNNSLAFGKLITSIYHTEYKDKITLGSDPVSGLNQWQNVAVTKINGIEFSYAGDLGNGWQPYANFSYTRSRDYAKPGMSATQSTRVAPRKLNLGVTYEPNATWSATLEGRAVSDMYFNSVTPAQHTGGYFIADAKVSMKLPVGNDKWEVFGACNNLTDKKYQPFNIGEWSDGRTFTIGVNGKL